MDKPGENKRLRSVSTRFNYALAGVISLTVVIFATIAVVSDISKSNSDLDRHLRHMLKVATTSLNEPLWNLDYNIVSDLVDALFLDEYMAYVGVSEGGRIVKERKRSADKGAPDFENSPRFVTQSSDIFHGTNKVGTIQLAMSREKVRQQIMARLSHTLLLAILMIAAIVVTSIVITRRYIARPLLSLQNSAALIAHGDLEAPIENRSHDEIGRLAEDLNSMRDSIKRLVGALRSSNAKLEDYSGPSSRRSRSAPRSCHTPCMPRKRRTERRVSSWPTCRTSCVRL